MESSSEKKDLGGFVAEKFNMTQQCVLAAQKANHKESGQQVEGNGSASLLCPHESDAPSSGVLNVKRVWACWKEPRAGHKNDERPGATSPVKTD